MYTNEILLFNFFFVGHTLSHVLEVHSDVSSVQEKLSEKTLLMQIVNYHTAAAASLPFPSKFFLLISILFRCFHLLSEMRVTNYCYPQGHDFKHDVCNALKKGTSTW